MAPPWRRQLLLHAVVDGNRAVGVGLEPLPPPVGQGEAWEETAKWLIFRPCWHSTSFPPKALEEN